MFRMQVTGRRLDDVQTSDSHSLQLVSKLAAFSCLTCTKFGFLQRTPQVQVLLALTENKATIAVLLLVIWLAVQTQTRLPNGHYYYRTEHTAILICSGKQNG